MPHTKQHLRALYLQKRSAISDENALRASHNVAENILSFCDFPLNATIAGYIPIQRELDILHSIAKLHAKGYKTALPIMRHLHSPLDFHLWKPGDALVESSLFSKLREPSTTAPAVIPQLILVPFLAFDRRGYRLGYGSGAYDRTLGHLREHGHSPLTIGVGYSIQEAEDLPHISFDQKVDYIITEKEVIHCDTK